METEKKIVGGFKEADINDEEIKDTLGKVLLARNSNDEVLRIISAKKQVVAGVKYIVEFEAKNPSSGEIKICMVSYVIQPWITKEPQIIEFTDKPKE